MHNAIRRKTLDTAEIEAECLAIKKMGFDHILLVTGESERKVGVDYFKQALPIIKKYFSHITIEVQPLDQHEYEELIEYGVDSVLVYQETYHPVTYAEHHLKGKKSDFKYRLDTQDRLGEAGIHKMGLGCLIGLEEWRTDCFYVAAHLSYLEKKYWQSRYTISFPRLRPCAGGMEIKSVMDDKQLVQLICAYRLFNPEVELSLSTRESEHFRDNVLPLGITSLSAGSSTQPGGYAEAQSRHLNNLKSVMSVHLHKWQNSLKNKVMKWFGRTGITAYGLKISQITSEKIRDKLCLMKNRFTQRWLKYVKSQLRCIKY